MTRYLIIVSRDRPDLLAPLAITYGRRGEAEILFDRRQGQVWTGPGDRPRRRTRSPRQCYLQEHGFLVIPRLTSTPRPAQVMRARRRLGVRPPGAHGITRRDAPSVRHL